MDLFCLVDVIADSIEKDEGNKLLCGLWFRGDEDSGSSIDGVWGPRFGSGEGE
jgi:hypothetical protein